MNPNPFRALARPLRAIFLDRDGVLNEKAAEGEYVSRWHQFRVLPGVPEAVARLNRAGLRVIVVSNQRGIARGLYTAADVDSIHSRFQGLLKLNEAHIDAFFICPHEEGQCDCRKPLPGLFQQAVQRFPCTSPDTSAMIGDSAADMEFGRRLGMATILIDSCFAGQNRGAATDGSAADWRCGSLAEAVDALLPARRSKFPSKADS